MLVFPLTEAGPSLVTVLQLYPFISFGSFNTSSSLCYPIPQKQKRGHRATKGMQGVLSQPCSLSQFCEGSIQEKDRSNTRTVWGASEGRQPQGALAEIQQGLTVLHNPTAFRYA